MESPTIKKTNSPKSLKQLYNEIAETSDAIMEKRTADIENRISSIVREDIQCRIECGEIAYGGDIYDRDAIEDIIGEYNFVSYGDEDMTTLCELNSRIEDVDMRCDEIDDIDGRVENIYRTILDLKQEIKELKKSTCTTWMENIKFYFNHAATNLFKIK